MRRTTKFAAVLAAGILALTACGSDDSNEPESGGDRKSALRRTVELVGAVALARAVGSEDANLADEILRSVR